MVMIFTSLAVKATLFSTIILALPRGQAVFSYFCWEILLSFFGQKIFTSPQGFLIKNFIFRTRQNAEVILVKRNFIIFDVMHQELLK